MSGTETYGEIVKRQFRKNTGAVVSLWALFFLFLVATYAPVLALDIPFTTNLEGTDGSPWLRSLIDPTVFPLAVDTFFNVLMATLPVLILLLLVSRGRVRRSLAVLWLIGHFVAFSYIDGIKEEYRQAPRDWPLEVYEAKASATFPPIRHHVSSQKTEFNLSPPFSRGELNRNAEPRSSPARMLTGTITRKTLAALMVSPRRLRNRPTAPATVASTTSLRLPPSASRTARTSAMGNDTQS